MQNSEYNECLKMVDGNCCQSQNEPLNLLKQWLKKAIYSLLDLASGHQQAWPLEIPAMCSNLIYISVAERESGCILVVYNISYMLVNKVWQNIIIRQTLIPPNFHRLQ